MMYAPSAAAERTRIRRPASHGYFFLAFAAWLGLVFLALVFLALASWLGCSFFLGCL